MQLTLEKFREKIGKFQTARRNYENYVALFFGGEPLNGKKILRIEELRKRLNLARTELEEFLGGPRRLWRS